MTLDQARARIGAGVVYRPHPDAPAEDGTITSVNERYVFVLYAGDRTPKATPAEALSFLVGGEGR